MVPDNQPPTPRQRGRPLTPVPDGRDLDAELSDLAAFFESHPATKPATISKAAGLKGPTIGDMLRKVRRPQAATLDKIYEALIPYHYKPRQSATKIN